jgi:hypothetical protein
MKNFQFFSKFVRVPSFKKIVYKLYKKEPQNTEALPHGLPI